MLTPNQEKWLKALESGEFKQTTKVLENTGVAGHLGFCCLGVACVVAEREGVPVERHMSLSEKVLKGVDLTAQPLVRQWLGLNTHNGFPTTLRILDANKLCLVNLNDNGKSFKEIAQIVRANPEHYFVTLEPVDRGSDDVGVLSNI